MKNATRTWIRWARLGAILALAVCVACGGAEKATKDSKKTVEQPNTDSDGSADLEDTEGAEGSAKSGEVQLRRESVEEESVQADGDRTKLEKKKDKKQERRGPKTGEDVSAEAGGGEHFAEDPGGSQHVLSGLATWRDVRDQGKVTASGESYDKSKLTASHPSLPYNTLVRVADPESLKSVDVRIIDRGPFKRGYIVELSYQAASELGVTGKDGLPVTLEVLKWGKGEKR